MILILFIWIVLAAVSDCSEARVLRVPTEYATIQGALDALLVNDTVLVDTGVYVEDLVAPPLPFALLGNVVDSSDTIRPIIDPSGLNSPPHRTCLTLSSGPVTIRNMVFRNGAAMHPHFTSDVGGILITEVLHLALHSCTFDSVYYGIFARGSLRDVEVTLEKCDFIHGQGRLVFANHVFADRCSFHSDTIDWAQLTFGDNSAIDSCSFSGNTWGGNAILGGGRIIRVSNCVFTDFEFAPVSSIVLLRGGGIDVTDNLFVNFPTGSGALHVSSDQWGPQNEIRGNVFEELHTPEGNSSVSGVCISITCDDEHGPCVPVLVYDNVLRYCTSNNGAVGMLIAGPCDVHHNVFEHLNEPDGVVVSVFDTDFIFRENIFRDNGVAMRCSGLPFHVNVEWNYWGHESGPYHPDFNPDGQGDVVGDSIDFEPWYTDTLFWTSIDGAPEVNPARWSLGYVFPNPFNDEFRIEFEGLTGTDFEIGLYDLLGREVALLHAGRTQGGALSFRAPVWLAAGLYFVFAHDQSFVETRKVVYLK